MTDAPVGFAEKPPTVAASHSKGRKSKTCSCDGNCKRLTGDMVYLKQRVANLADRLELLDGAKRKQEVWTYKCMVPGCGQLIVVGAPETMVGQTMKCPVHGVVPLDLVSPRPAS